MLVILIVSIIFVIVLISYYIVPKVLTNTTPFKNVWDDDEKNKINILLENSIKCLNKLNIEFFPVYGTLIGTMRHQGLIPWDDDVDICIEKNMFRTILRNKKLFDEYNIEVYLVTRDPKPFIKLFDKNTPKIKNNNWAWPFIDIFGYKIKDDKFIIEQNSYPYEEIFDVNDIFPLTTAKFENFDVKIPKNTVKILNYLYKDDWKDVCYSSGFNHKKELFYKNTYKIDCNEVI